MKILFVPDSNPYIGLGHLSRCLALAQAIKILFGQPSTFLMEDQNSRDWLYQRGFDSVPVLSGNWDVVVLDSYRITPSVSSELRGKAKLFCVFDDLGTPPKNANLVINSSIRLPISFYSDISPTSLLLGPVFHPLRAEYWALAPCSTSPKVVSNVLITLGGGIPSSKLVEIAQELRKLHPLGQTHVLLGPHVKDTEYLALDKKLIIHHSPLKVRDVFSMADIAISAGGQTLYELAYLGIPTIAIEIAENQRENILGFSTQGAVFSVGNINLHEWKIRLKEALIYLLNEPARRMEMSRVAQQLIDGKGALRLAKVLIT